MTNTSAYYYTPTKSQIGCPNQTLSGYAEMGELIWPAIADANLSVVDLTPNHAKDAVFEETSSRIREKLVSIPINPKVQIINMVPTFWGDLWCTNATRIGYTTFETSKLPKQWVERCNDTDEVWTTSDWNKQVMQDSGVTKKILAIPPIARELGPVTYKKRKVFTFLSCFHWSERKNPGDLITAFCCAFDEKDDVQLIIKTNSNETTQKITHYINKKISNIHLKKAPRVLVLNEKLTSKQMEKLYAKADAYVSLSHGEGWGLPAWDAVLYGLPTIHTGWSAPKDFVIPCLAIDYTLSPVTKRNSVSPFFEPGMWWAQPSIADAVDKMRAIYNNYENWRMKACAHRDTITKRFSKERLLNNLHEESVLWRQS